MKNNWFLISLIGALVAGFLSFLIVKSWKINLVIGTIVLIIMLLNNPIRRYMRAFWVVFGMLSLMHRFSFEFIGNLAGIDFKLGSIQMHWTVSSGLLIIAIICLRLDYLERNKKSGSTILSIQKNEVGNINGNGNQINQTND